MEQEKNDVDVPEQDNEEAEESNHLPSERVEIIMKSCLGVRKVEIREDTLLLVSKCTEMLIKEMANRCFAVKKQEEPTASNIDYDSLVDVVHNDQKFDFLTEIIPRKITFAKCKELLRKKEMEESMPKKKPPPKERKKKPQATKATKKLPDRLQEVPSEKQRLQDKKTGNSALHERISMQVPLRHTIQQKSDSVAGPSSSIMASYNAMTFEQGNFPMQLSEEVVIMPVSNLGGGHEDESHFT